MFGGSDLRAVAALVLLYDTVAYQLLAGERMLALRESRKMLLAHWSGKPKPF